MGLIPKMPTSEPETYDVVCDVPREAAEALGVPELERFDQLESLGLVRDGMHRIPDGGGRFYQVRYKASFVGRAVVRKVAAWNRLERDKRESKRLHPFIGDPERVASARRLGRDLAMLAVGALVSRAVDAAISMLP